MDTAMRAGPMADPRKSSRESKSEFQGNPDHQSSCQGVVSRTTPPIDLETFLEKRNRIRAEFERCKQQGLLPPSWSDLGRIARGA